MANCNIKAGIETKPEKPSSSQGKFLGGFYKSAHEYDHEPAANFHQAIRRRFVTKFVDGTPQDLN